MDNATFDQLALERTCKALFGVDVEVKQVIAWRVPVNRTDHATVFLTTKKQLYAYVEAQSRLLFSDVKKIMSRMGLKAELYVPPKGRPNYFDEIGLEKFKQVFPGRKDVGEYDLVFYRTLAPYCPALILVSEVKDGTIYCADSDAASGWRPAAKFAYRRIKTS